MTYHRSTLPGQTGRAKLSPAPTDSSLWPWHTLGRPAHDTAAYRPWPVGRGKPGRAWVTL